MRNANIDLQDGREIGRCGNIRLGLCLVLVVGGIGFFLTLAIAILTCLPEVGFLALLPAALAGLGFPVLVEIVELRKHANFREGQTNLDGE